MQCNYQFLIIRIIKIINVDHQNFCHKIQTQMPYEWSLQRNLVPVHGVTSQWETHFSLCSTYFPHHRLETATISLSVPYRCFKLSECSSWDFTYWIWSVSWYCSFQFELQIACEYVLYHNCFVSSENISWLSMPKPFSQSHTILFLELEVLLHSVSVK